MSYQEQSIPEDFDFTPEDVAKMSVRAKLQKGFYRLLIQDVQKATSRSGSLQMILTLIPLKDADDGESGVHKLSIRHYLTYPIRNPEIEGHVAPNTGGICRDFLRAVVGDLIPTYPRRDPESKELMYQGEPIDSEEEEYFKQEADNALLAQLRHFWKAPQELVGMALYADVVEDGDYMKVKKAFLTLPDDKELTPADEFTTQQAPTVLLGKKGVKGVGSKKKASKVA
jgi:hypothetical protein